MKKSLIILVLLSCMLSAACFAQDLSGIPSGIHGPKELSEWFLKDFDYEMDVTNNWQMPQETIDAKKGSCADFAILASAVLSDMGVPNDIIIIKFKYLEIAHAVCIWKNEYGTYDFISNKTLCHSGKRSIEDAIGRFYPDWEEIIFATPHKVCLGVTTRP